MADRPIGLVETPAFARDANRLLRQDEYDDLIRYLSANPLAGVVIPGLGGARKLRWSYGGHGKRGGVRVVYYFHSHEIPLLLFAVFAKNERSDMSTAQRKELVSIIAAIQREQRT